MNEENIINYYNKFNEDKRLLRRHGIVEYETAMKYILEYLKFFKDPKILDVGAGTGRYAICLHKLGYDVTALELVKHNLMTLRKNCSEFPSFQGTALDLSRFKDNSFDIVILFGPMYHLISDSDKIKALSEVKRILKSGGLVFISYYMNEYAIIKHGFMERKIKDSIKSNLIDSSFHVTPKYDDLYSMVRLEDINRYKDILSLKRVKIIAQDGLTDYIRKNINDLDEEEFDLYWKYHLSICERPEILGFSSHIMDILKKC